MYEIFTLIRDDWGKLYYVRHGKMQKKLPEAIRKCRKLPRNSYVKRYGSTIPAYIKGDLV